jgi:hypothetical protein
MTAVMNASQAVYTWIPWILVKIDDLSETQSKILENAEMLFVAEFHIIFQHL